MRQCRSSLSSTSLRVGCLWSGLPRRQCLASAQVCCLRINMCTPGSRRCLNSARVIRWRVWRRRRHCSRHLLQRVHRFWRRRSSRQNEWKLHQLKHLGLISCSRVGEDTIRRLHLHCRRGRDPACACRRQSMRRWAHALILLFPQCLALRDTSVLGA